MSDRKSLIVLLSDLGSRDPAVAQFKSAVFAVTTNIEFLDATHEIPPRNLLEGAFTLARLYRDFPRRTAFVVLLEAITGAPRRPILAVSMDYYYFAPDNGVLSFIYDQDDVSNVYGITADHLVKPTGPLSVHRDLYGTAVGWWAKGLDSSNFGDPVTDYQRVAIPKPQLAPPRELKGMILHVSRNGQLVTNVHSNDINAIFAQAGQQVPFRMVVGDQSIPVVGSWTEGSPDLFATYGASSHLEICSAKADASKALNAKRGDAVTIVFG
jgi:S-adenosylmethionine hydrolase